MRLLATTIVRHAPLGRPSGFLSVVEFPGGTVLARYPVPDSPFRRLDPNPRGGLRGAKGIAVTGERLAVATTDCVYLFDRNWNSIQVMSHPLAAGLHDLLACPEGLWLTATHCDLLLKFDWDGQLQEVWDWRSQSLLKERFLLPQAMPVDQSLDYRRPDVPRRHLANLVHLNGVAAGDDHGLLLSFGRIVSPRTLSRLRIEALYQQPASWLGVRKLAGFSLFHLLARKRWCGVSHVYQDCSAAIVRLERDRSATVLRQSFDISEPNHNVLQMGDWLLFCETTRQRLAIVSQTAQIEDCYVEIPGAPSFPRGLAAAGDGAVFAGSQAPAAIYRIDVEAGTIAAACPLPFPEEAVYAIAPLPDSFSAPPAEIHFQAT